MAAKGDFEALLALLKKKRLDNDPNFFILTVYYSNLKEGGDGELLVKLLKGKMTIKGATYLKKVVIPSAGETDGLTSGGMGKAQDR